MRAFLRGRHWRLLWAVLCFAVVCFLSAFLSSGSPDPVRLAFSRVQLGMTEREVDAIVSEINQHKVFPQRHEVLVFEDVAVTSQAQLGHPGKDYWLSTGEISVEFLKDRAVGVSSWRYETAADKLRMFLKQLRAAVGL